MSEMNRIEKMFEGIIVDYIISPNCVNKNERYSDICYKCGECGREFNRNGIITKEAEGDE